MNPRLAALALAPAALLMLGGCGTRAGVAASVGGTSIRTSEVDFLTNVQCKDLETYLSAQGQPAAPISLVRQQALATLIDSLENEKFADSQGASYDTATFKAQVAQVSTLVSKLPKSHQQEFQDILEDIYKGQLRVTQIGRLALLAEGKTKPTSDEVAQAGTKARDAWAKSQHLKIKVDPIYAPGKSGLPGSGDASLSKPVSSFAKAAAAGQPSASFIEGLPKNQKCG